MPPLAFIFSQPSFDNFARFIQNYDQVKSKFSVRNFWLNRSINAFCIGLPALIKSSYIQGLEPIEAESDTQVQDYFESRRKRNLSAWTDPAPVDDPALSFEHGVHRCPGQSGLEHRYHLYPHLAVVIFLFVRNVVGWSMKLTLSRTGTRRIDDGGLSAKTGRRGHRTWWSR